MMIVMRMPTVSLAMVRMAMARMAVARAVVVMGVRGAHRSFENKGAGGHYKRVRRTLVSVLHTLLQLCRPEAS